MNEYLYQAQPHSFKCIMREVVCDRMELKLCKQFHGAKRIYNVNIQVKTHICPTNCKESKEWKGKQNSYNCKTI